MKGLLIDKDPNVKNKGQQSRIQTPQCLLLSVYLTDNNDKSVVTALMRTNFKLELCSRRKAQAAFSSGGALGHSTFWHTVQLLAQTLGANLAPLVQGGIKVKSPWRT